MQLGIISKKEVCVTNNAKKFDFRVFNLSSFLFMKSLNKINPNLFNCDYKS